MSGVFEAPEHLFLKTLSRCHPSSTPFTFQEA